MQKSEQDKPPTNGSVQSTHPMLPWNSHDLADSFTCKQN